MKKLISLVSLFCLSVFLPLSVMGEPIDREAVVKRHRVCTTGTLLKSPAQVGNGKFAFGMDITGLQTFVPFNTLSDWSWHSFHITDKKEIDENLSLFYLINFYKQYLHKEILLYA